MYYLVINGQRTGPYEAHDIQRMLKQGAIGYDTLFWKDGMFDWASVGSQRHLFETTHHQPQAQFYEQPQYQQPQYGQPQYQQQQMQPYGQRHLQQQQQMFASPPKSRVAFILLGLFLGGLGVHNFYAGYSGKGVAQLLLTLFLWWTIVVPIGVTIWIIVEVCTVDRDAYGNPLV
jgi:TM2 domain-containing membrane protein YozV